MSAAAIFESYKLERKGQAIPGFRYENVCGLARYTPTSANGEGIVMFCESASHEIDSIIDEQISYFKDLNISFEWKVYALDRPADLNQRLVSRGFEEGEVEAFMVYTIGSPQISVRSDGIEIRRLSTDLEIELVVKLQEEVWQRDLSWLSSNLRESREINAIYGAFEDGQLVGTGWMEFPRWSKFAELHGGAVIATHRKRGIYLSLFNHRLIEAKRRGYPFISVDAAPMSRPILAKIGFTEISETRPYRMAF